MMIHRGAVSSCLIFFVYFFTTAFEVTRGIREQPSNSLTDEDELQSPSYFFYQHPDYPRDCIGIRERCASTLETTSGTYFIKPNGYREPFEVFCNNDIDSGGWTVVLRRTDGCLNFNRGWEDYKVGFGFLSTEHWLGNEKLSYLTNQAEYELRADFVLSNGSSFYVKYTSFRISDEWSQYAFVSTGTFHGNASLAVSDCPLNMVYKNTTCQPTCDDPNGSIACPSSNTLKDEECVCVEGFLKKGDLCVPPGGCGCFVAQDSYIIPNNETYVNTDCSEKCACQQDQLICNSNYECSPNAACRVKNNVRKCYCNEGYEGDGETCIPLYKDCYDAYHTGRQRQDGIYTIMPNRWPGSPFDVYCDMTTSGGGWTIFQRRIDRATSFYRNWRSYSDGFGSLQEGSDFWLGNEKLYYLTNNYQQGSNRRSYKLRIDIVTSGGSRKYDEYASFRTDSETTKYRLIDLGSHSGNAGNGMEYTSGNLFSTFDSDNDQCGNHNCARGHRGAWWYKPSAIAYDRDATHCTNCGRNSHCDQFTYGSAGCSTVCSKANLNSDYTGTRGKNIYWSFSGNCNLRSAEMKIRPT